jgi:GNAT superfamily N-acetyltransferase
MINYYRAGIDDIKAIADFRIQFMKDSSPELEDVIFEDLHKRVLDYLVVAVPADECVHYFAKNENQIVGGGGFALRKYAPGLLLPDGVSAYIYNMFTVPDFRKQGIAHQIMRLLMQEAKQRNITRVELHATEMGSPLYKELGFHLPAHVYLEWFPNSTEISQNVH